MFQALGSWERKKRESERKNEGGLRRFFLARFRSSPTTESLKQANLHQKIELKGKTKFAIISVKTVKLAMENLHSLF